jgi:holo-[acyl-carrier protein] synthase
MRIGIDILLISRFARITESPRYCRVLFTEKELRRAAGLRASRRHEHLAGRFCAKEAVAKMLGRGFGQGLVWRDIEILADPWGAPLARLHDGAARIADGVGLTGISLSLAHQGDMAVCVAVEGGSR